MSQPAKLKTPIQVVIVGAGFGRYGHLPAYKLDSRFEVVGVYGSSPESTARFAEQAQVRNRHRTLDEALKDPAVQWVSLACPPRAQLKIAFEALERGQTLFLEKPMGDNLADCERLVAELRRRSGRALVNFIFPQLETFRAMKRAIDEGKIGDIRHFYIDWRMETHDIAKGLKTWKTDVREGGGLLSHFISHSLYYAEWFFGDVKNFDLRGFNSRESFRSSSLLSARLETARGLSGALSASNAAPGGSGHRIEVTGSRGTLILENTTADAVRGFRLLHRTEGREPFTMLLEEPILHPQLDARVEPTRRNIAELLESTDLKNIEGALRVQRLISEKV